MNGPHSEETIFAAMMRLPPEERAAYLDQACGGDVALRQRIERLLNSYEESGGFLEGGAAPTLRESSQTVAPAEKPGERIGRYKLLQQIGEGGCGAVYMAEQEEPVRRRVALKVIKLGMDTKSVIGRFESERQALAMMDHPNIAKVLDADATETGRPYFVMELVRGVKITEYCDQNNLSTADRLDLFIQVCHAVQHAHQKGIIHRDIKPSNILVTLQDGLPVPKVIDFGIAKATQGRLTDHTLFTAFEQFIGTPAYSSPEQAEMHGFDIDTRSDIYSLGVLLYELLTGKTPFETKELLAAGLDAMRRTIREKEPERPSARLSTMIEAELIVAATRRHTEAPKLINLVRGDLDWIVMRCLEKQRTRRYETASALAADLQRHLSREPVMARPPTTLYRLQTFVRRNRLVVVAAGLVISTLILGIGISSRMYLQELKARQRAQAAEKHNEQLAKTEQEMRLKAEEQSRIANSMRLAAQSQSLRSEMPSLSALLALEAVDVTRREGKPVLPVAHESLFYALGSVGGRALPGHDAAVALALISPDGRWLVTAGGRGVPILRDLQDPAFTPYPLGGHETNVTRAAFSPNSRLLVIGSSDGTVRFWKLDRPMLTNPQVLNGDGAPVTQLTFSPSGHWLAIQSGDDLRRERLIVRELNVDDSEAGAKPLLDWSGKSPMTPTAALIVTPDGPWLTRPTRLTPCYGGLRLWDLTTREPKTRMLTTKAVYPAAIGPNRHWMAAVIQNERAADQLLLLDLRKPVLSYTGTVLDLNDAAGWSPLAFSGDDRFLTIGNGNSVYLVDLSSDESGSSLRLLSRHASVTYATAMSHDGHWAASGDTDGTVRLWDIFSGGAEPVARVLSGHVDTVYRIVVSPDGRWLATGSEDKTVRLWPLNSQTPEINAQVLRGHDSWIDEMAITPDSRLLVTSAAYDAVPRIWDLSADMPSREIVLRASGLRHWYSFHRPLSLSPDGHWLAARGTPALIWNLRSENPANTGIPLALPGEESRQLTRSDPLSYIVPRALSGRWLVSERRGALRRLWDLKAKDPAASQQPLPDSTGPICISPDDKWLVTASSGDVQLRNLMADTPTNSVILSGGRKTVSVGISPDSRWLVAGDEDGIVRVWDLSVEVPEASMKTLVGHSQSVSQVLFGGEGRWLFTAGNDGTIRVWELRSEDFSAAVRVVRLGEFVPRANSDQRREIRVSPDGRWIVTAITFQDSNFELWHLPAQASSGAHCVLQALGSRLAEFSPNSRWLITAAGGIPTLWDLTAKAPEASKRTLHGQIVVDGAAFSPDSRWLATAGLEGTTGLWDLHNSTLSPIVLRGHSDSVRGVDFTADGRWLVTGSDDRTARLWEMDLDRLVGKVRSQVGRDFTSEERKTYHLEARR